MFFEDLLRPIEGIFTKILTKNKSKYLECPSDLVYKTKPNLL